MDSVANSWSWMVQQRRIIYRPVDGEASVVAVTDSAGKFCAKVTPGSYTVYVSAFSRFAYISH